MCVWNSCVQDGRLCSCDSNSFAREREKPIRNHTQREKRIEDGGERVASDEEEEAGLDSLDNITESSVDIDYDEDIHGDTDTHEAEYESGGEDVFGLDEGVAAPEDDDQADVDGHLSSTLQTLIQTVGHQVLIEGPA